MATVAFQPENRLPDGEVIAPPPITTDPSLCVVCRVGKRAGSGILTRCLSCIRVDAQRARDARVAAEATLAARLGGPVKECRTCKRSRCLDEFARHARSRDGRRRDCKRCVTAGKIERARPVLSPEAKARDRARRRTPQYRAQNLAAAISWQARNTDAVSARKAVSAAKKSGALVPAKSCEVQGCKKRKALCAHHNNYSPSRHLKVAWICRGHHQALHHGLTFKLKPSAMCKTAFAPPTA